VPLGPDDVEAAERHDLLVLVPAGDPRALERLARRKLPVPSWYFDLNLLGGYFGERRVYHHTAPIAAIVGLAEALRRIEAEGIDARVARHRAAAQRLVAGLEERGFEPVVAPETRLPMLTSVRLPERVVRDGEAALRRRLLDRHDIEVGGGLGKFAGSVWRIGLMGENARANVVDRLLDALDRELGN
jgi:alanine-glyoxylate transaminase/serine-glyoxylate transaminase/serine-pyruvate transaminase